MTAGWLLLIGSSLLWTRARGESARQAVLSLPGDVRDERQHDANRRLEQMLGPGGNRHLRALWFSSRIVSIKPDPYARFRTSSAGNNIMWSPDARLLAFVAYTGYTADIFLLDIETSLVVPLTTEAAWDYQPVWSPDGSQIAFTSTRDGKADIYLYDISTNRTYRLTTHPEMDWHPEWAPDGRVLTYTAERNGKQTRVMLDMAHEAPQVVARR